MAKPPVHEHCPPIPGVDLRDLIHALLRLIKLLEPRRTTLIVTVARDIPRIAQRSNRMDLGNKFFDQVAGTNIVVTPNGPVTGAAAQVSSEVDVTITNISADGLTFDINYPERDIAAASVTVTVPVDLPATPDVESISTVINFSLSHSLATLLSVVATDIPR